MGRLPGLALALASALSREAGDRSSEAIALRIMSGLEEPAVALGLVERSIELCRSAGALRIELTAKQVWVDLLWKSGARADARRESRELADEAARRRLRQTVSLVELQGAEWAANERDWSDTRARRDAAFRLSGPAFALLADYAAERASLKAMVDRAIADDQWVTPEDLDRDIESHFAKHEARGGRL